MARQTPYWSLVGSATGLLLLSLVLLVSRGGASRGFATFIESAGRNSLMIYLLPEFYRALISTVGLGSWEQGLSAGWVGVVRSGLLTVFVIGVFVLLQKRGLRISL